MTKRMYATIMLLVVLLCSRGAMASGSWAQINQDLHRPDGWRQIVLESAFQLGGEGEKALPGEQAAATLSYGTYPSIDGSTVAVPMAMEFARQHLGLPDEDLPGFVFFSTTHGAYEHLIGSQPNGAAMIASRMATMDATRPVDLILATPPSDEEMALAEAQDVTLVMAPLCYDAFVFITHVDNPIDSLTVQQIQGIYAGEITNWQQVGGADAAIYPYQREANSGSQTAMAQMVMQGKPLDGAKPHFITDGMGGLIRRVGDYENSENSLGYTYKYYIDTLYQSDAIKVLAIGGVAPTPDNLRSGAYPFTANYYGVIRGGEEEAVGGRFLQWMLSDEGQRCIQQAGYVPMREETP